MRIVAGRLGGRVFASPHGHKTHPMADKVRGALFNALGELDGLTVLDAFAGSGALSFEALSRGAASVVALDNDAQAFRTMRENARALGVEGEFKPVKATVLQWLSTAEADFDIVLCDPPYDDLQLTSVLAAAERVRANGLLVVSLPPEAELEPRPAFDLLQRKNYGDATLAFYRRLS